jgi:hypothetical protein
VAIAQGYRDRIGAIVDRMFPQLHVDRWERLVEDLIDAVGFALAGLDGVVRGRRTRASAWSLDIFVRDICDAMWRACLQVSMHPDPRNWSAKAQALALELVKMAGLPGHNGEGPGNLFKQMQRGRRIVKTQQPNLRLEKSGSDEWIVTIGEPEERLR